MMTIKEFALLCGCKTQTLRYYDNIDLLKPVRVDQWSGYRYYEKQQAMDFVKIKNLQAADFSIEEIKTLLSVSDQQVYEAFERKIEEQSRKLERIRKIQKSYLTEKNNMQKLVENLSDYLLHSIRDFEVLREFGLSPDQGAEIVERVKEYIEACMLWALPDEQEVCMSVDGTVFHGAEQISEAIANLMDTDYSEDVLLGEEDQEEHSDFSLQNSTVLWERGGWDHVHEFIDEIPSLEKGCEYCCYFRLKEGKVSDGLEFPVFMIGAMLPKINSNEIPLGCVIKDSEDGTNYFALLCRPMRAF